MRSSWRRLLVGFSVLLSSAALSGETAAPGSVAGHSSELADKIRLLQDSSAKNVVLRLNGAKFREFVKSPTRNYSFVVLFAAMAPHRQCAVCSAVHDEFELTAKSYRLSRQGGLGELLFFGYVDFDENVELFRLMNVNSIPVIVFFSSGGKTLTKTDVLDMRRYGYTAESIAKWIWSKSAIKFQVIRPPELVGTAGLLVLFFLGSVVIYLRCETCGFFNNRTMWAIVAVGFCLLMTSGQMWNHIRCPPFLTRTPDGALRYIHGSSNAQLIGESYIVFLLNAGITVSVIILIDNGYSESCFRRNKILPLLCTILAGLFYHLLLSVFRSKTSNYPYRGLL